MCIKGCLQKSLDSTLPLQIQWNKWYEMRGLWARLNTHRGFGTCVWALLPLGGIYMRMMITEIQILRYRWYRWDMIIQMRYKPLGLVWVHTEDLGRVLGRLVLWGQDFACTDMVKYMRYEMAFSRLSVVAPGHNGSLIACPSRSGYDEIIPLGTCLVIVFGIQYLIL